MLGLACLAFNDAASAAASQDVVVISVKGDVTVTMRGTVRPVHTGTTVDLPAAIRTGADGAIALRQGPTTVSIAAKTQIQIPESASLGEPIDRVLQPQGSAFYDVGKRLGKKLRVETPYLVAVIKGTQF
ncbi:MAG TPA: FecR domain-containing protein, partial [Steroidobacteraceae bacterium]